MDKRISFNLNELAEPESLRESLADRDNDLNDCNSNMEKDASSVNTKKSISFLSQMRNVYKAQVSNKVNISVRSTCDDINLEGEPIQLIDFSHGFRVNPKAIDFLNSIKEDIIIVSVVGKARTGKSYLMNLLLDIVGKSNGFKVASSLKSCTKGIWLCSIIKKSLNSNAKILFLDSEGTSSTDKSTKTYDSRIFALVVLISSLFLYNTYSNIDEYGINELSLAAHLSSAISTNSNINKDELLTQLAPNFIWIVRDFTLEKIHPETGEEISSKEYLELCLKNKKCAKNSNDNNSIRQNIIKYFPERDCVTLVRPVDNESDLKNLNNIPFSNLKPEFKLEFKKLKDKVYKDSFPKKYNGRRLNGPILANLITEFINVINSGKIPNINNTWDSVIEKDINDFFDKATTYYKQEVSTIKPMQSNIYSSYDLTKKLNDIKYKSIFTYNKILENNSETFKHKKYKELYEEKLLLLSENISKNNKRIRTSNERLCINNIKNAMTEGYRSIESRLYKNDYNTRNYKDLIDDDRDYLTGIDNKIRPFSQKNDILLDNIIANEINYIKYLSEMCKKDGVRNIQKLDYDLKEAQAELEAVDNRRVLADEKDKINEGKVNDLRSKLDELNEELEALRTKHKNKKDFLLKLKQKLKQEKLKKEELNLTPLKHSDDETISNGGSLNTDKVRKKMNKEACNCQCFIY